MESILRYPKQMKYAVLQKIRSRQIGGVNMFFRRFTQKIYGFLVMGFVVGVFIAFVMPPIIIAVIEGLLLGILCWCFYCL